MESYRSSNLKADADDVQIGPQVNLITENHPLDPSQRQALLLGAIVIKRNAWIGAAATILPGVDACLKRQLAAQQQVALPPTPKKARGASRVDAADKLYGTYVSRMRQPIESLFKWLIDRDGLQDGSQLRSEQGVWWHGLGRLAAGLHILAFYP